MTVIQTKTFKINEISETELRIDTVASVEDKFGEWFNYVDINSVWFDSLPVKRFFKVPIDKKEEIKKALIQHGYSEIN
ncbi:hypothetical protein M0813_08852 [Anaeramoeba flamelloides]|uniref:Uncharacterized protein n=1 Tax=Anaeramoeba flamelloides TaxID=1746091 RepID=A0ABQ8X8K3_9EUKA|nr:hypothetical protein M0813_08852 [Anaeramoeba flamelloides]